MRKLLMILFIGMFLISFASAEIFTFDNKVTYSQDNKTVLIENVLDLFGDNDIATVELLSPMHQYLLPGEDMEVARFNVTGYKDYKDFVKAITFEDMKKDRKEFLRNYDLKMLYYEDYQKPIYETTCGYYNNFNDNDCVSEIVGYETIKLEKWEKLTPADLKKNEWLTIGLFTEVKNGDYVDWKPTFAGKKVERWATWEASYNTSLISYYRMEETSGNAIDTMGNHDLSTTLTQDYGATGMEGNCFNYESANSDRTEGTLFDKDGYSELSVNFWFKVESFPASNYGTIFNLEEASSYGGLVFMLEPDAEIYTQFGDGTAGGITDNIDASLSTGNWYMATMTHNSTHNNVYINGVLESSVSASAFANGGNTLRIGNYNANWYYDGLLDELAFWSDDISQTMITDLYDSGTGTFMVGAAAPDNYPNIDVVSPTGWENLTDIFTQSFNISVADDFTIDNVTLMVNGSVVATNTTEMVGTKHVIFSYTFPSSSYYIWNATVFDNNSQSNTTGNNYVTVNVPAPTVELYTPTPWGNYSTTSNVTFLCDATSYNYNIIQNVSLLINGAINQTRTTPGNATNHTWYASFPDGDYNWSCSSYNNLSIESVYVNRTFTLETTNPVLNITYPYNNVITYHKFGDLDYLNWTLEEINFKNASYVYDGNIIFFNETRAKETNWTSFNISSAGTNTINMYANDTYGNNVTNTTNFEVLSMETNFKYDATLTSNAEGKYYANITSNGSAVTNAFLFYDGNPYTATITNFGSDFYGLYTTRTASGNGAKTLFFSYDVLEYGSINTTERTQTITPINFSLCSGTNSVPFLNFTFRDEADSSYINASADSIDVDFWVGDEGDASNYVDSRTTNHSNYSFCFTPADEEITLNISFKYSGDGYPLRTYTLNNQNLTNVTTNTTLYLLSSADGIYNSIQVVNTAGDPLSDVKVIGERQILGVWITIGSEITGDDGLVSMWVNPNYKHRFTFTKTGYVTQQVSVTPSASTLFVTLQSSTDTIADDLAAGISQEIYPKTSTELVNDTAYNFIYNVTASSVWTVSHFGFTLKLDNGTIIGRGYSDTVGTGASSVYNVNNQSKVNMEYYYVVDGEYRNTTGIYWVVTNSLYTDWSLKTFFTDFNSYKDDGIFGMDNFAMTLIIFLILFFVIGVMGFKYGMKNPIFIASITFVTIFFFDVVVDLMPDIRGINNLLTYIAGLALVIIIFREGSR